MSPVVSKHSYKIVTKYEIVSPLEKPIQLGMLTAEYDPISKKEILLERFFFGDKQGDESRTDKSFFAYVRNGSGSTADKLDMKHYAEIFRKLQRNPSLKLKERIIEKYPVRSGN